jgi:hypothetical protein
MIFESEWYLLEFFSRKIMEKVHLSKYRDLTGRPLWRGRLDQQAADFSWLKHSQRRESVRVTLTLEFAETRGS